MKLCHRCNAECDEKAVFCEKCGAYLDVCDPDAAVKELNLEQKPDETNKV